VIKEVDSLIIGAGPAGMAAAIGLQEAGVQNVLIVEREPKPGGILLQCIHNGFGLHRFNEELTGPEYAERDINLIKKHKIDLLVNTCAIDIIDKNEYKEVVLLSSEKGLLCLHAKTVILAMGCRERNRGNISIPGSRPAGIMTAGQAQKLVNMYGYLPGKEIVVLGSGDIGLIMARRTTWEGAHVKAVVEVQPYPGGLNRNIVQCLNDFHIPLYLSHTISNIIGNPRIESVEISPLDEHREPRKEESFDVKCDTLLLSIGLIPENELSIKAGVDIDPVTMGPLVDVNLMTSVPGIFSCGNVLQVHDLVDYASEEAEHCGKSAAAYITGKLGKGCNVSLREGNMVRYIVPKRVEPGKEALLSLRPMAPADNMQLVIKTDKDNVLYKKKYRKVFPSIMLRIHIKKIPEDARFIDVYFDTIGS
jgi:NADPH-dependent 2,4-dienoyl-CoA reductase/sulfur reductase-like enzyme